MAFLKYMIRKGKKGMVYSCLLSTIATQHGMTVSIHIYRFYSHLFTACQCQRPHYIHGTLFGFAIHVGIHDDPYIVFFYIII